MAFAHSANQQRVRHDLVEHLRAVGELARALAAAFQSGEPAYYSGLWHDVGKFDPAFQDYLRRCELNPNGGGRGPDHKRAGMLLAAERFPLGTFLIQGHHGGLRDEAAVKADLASARQDAVVQAAIAAARAALPDLQPAVPLKVPPSVERDPLSADLWLRFLLSTLADADYLDTERHFNVAKAAARVLAPPLAMLQDRFERNRLAFLADRAGANRAGPVAAIRDEIYASCIAAAAEPPGMFRLTVPTGGGKTIAALGFALEHARRHGQRRLIVAVPYISITQQTTTVYRDLLEDAADEAPVVLEHHSGALGAGEDGEDFHACHVWERLASENWDAPVIVTTTVQLLESLFAAGTSRCRKLHRIAGSIVVIDEAQTLPADLLEPILDVLRRLTAEYGVTVVLSTATQPAFEAIPAFAGVAATELVPQPERYFQALRRVRYEWRIDEPVEWPALAALMRAENQALAILNTKRDALALLAALDNDPAALHLSTLLCGAHRTEVIDKVKRRLAAGEPCRLISTQVVEAGVDVDFPLVLRALGPLDGVIQAAGRCNREGRLAAGRVIVFRPVDGGLPRGLYRMATTITEALRKLEPVDLDDRLDVVERYFRAVYGAGSPDRPGIQQLRRQLEFRQVDKEFRLIDEDTESVVILDYGDEAVRKRINADLNALQNRTGSARLTMRRLQPYTVTLYRPQAEQCRQAGLIQPIMPGVGVWLGKYDSAQGLVVGDQPPDKLVL